jgi:hypothetical protein
MPRRKHSFRQAPLGTMRSKLELQVSAKLTELGVAWEYECYALEYFKPIRNAICFECEGAKVFQRCWYYPDLWLPEHGYHIEVKGKFGQVDRMKMRLVREAHPDEPIRMVFSRNNLIGRQSQTNTRYIDYAEKYGMPSCVLENLEEWFK